MGLDFQPLDRSLSELENSQQRLFGVVATWADSEVPGLVIPQLDHAAELEVDCFRKVAGTALYCELVEAHAKARIISEIAVEACTKRAAFFEEVLPGPKVRIRKRNRSISSAFRRQLALGYKTDEICDEAADIYGYRLGSQVSQLLAIYQARIE